MKLIDSEIWLFLAYGTAVGGAVHSQSYGVAAGVLTVLIFCELRDFRTEVIRRLESK